MFIIYYLNTFLWIYICGLVTMTHRKAITSEYSLGKLLLK